MGREAGKGRIIYHSRSEYIIVKKTCRNRFTALINTARRYSHASPDIMVVVSRLSAYFRCYTSLAQTYVEPVEACPGIVSQTRWVVYGSELRGL